jgi:hypothetical protein
MWRELKLAVARLSFLQDGKMILGFGFTSFSPIWKLQSRP